MSKLAVFSSVHRCLYYPLLLVTLLLASSSPATAQTSPAAPDCTIYYNFELTGWYLFTLIGMIVLLVFSVVIALAFSSSRPLFVFTVQVTVDALVLGNVFAQLVYNVLRFKDIQMPCTVSMDPNCPLGGTSNVDPTASELLKNFFSYAGIAVYLLAQIFTLFVNHTVQYRVTMLEATGLRVDPRLAGLQLFSKGIGIFVPTALEALITPVQAIPLNASCFYHGNFGTVAQAAIALWFMCIFSLLVLLLIWKCPCRCCGCIEEDNEQRCKGTAALFWTIAVLEVGALMFLVTFISSLDFSVKVPELLLTSVSISAFRAVLYVALMILKACGVGRGVGMKAGGQVVRGKVSGVEATAANEEEAEAAQKEAEERMITVLKDFYEVLQKYGLEQLYPRFFYSAPEQLSIPEARKEILLLACRRDEVEEPQPDYESDIPQRDLYRFGFLRFPPLQAQVSVHYGSCFVLIILAFPSIGGVGIVGAFMLINTLLDAAECVGTLKALLMRSADQEELINFGSGSCLNSLCACMGDGEDFFYIVTRRWAKASLVVNVISFIASIALAVLFWDVSIYFGGYAIANGFCLAANIFVFMVLHSVRRSFVLEAYRYTRLFNMGADHKDNFWPHLTATVPDAYNLMTVAINWPAKSVEELLTKAGTTMEEIEGYLKEERAALETQEKERKQLSEEENYPYREVQWRDMPPLVDESEHKPPEDDESPGLLSTAVASMQSGAQSASETVGGAMESAKNAFGNMMSTAGGFFGGDKKK